MKISLIALLTFCLLTALHAQAPAQVAAPARTPEQLDELLGPIALYSDALVALILPASTMPSEVVLAARYVAANGGAGQVDSQSWDPSVKALAHFPDTLKWMDENLQWTTDVGTAFLDQPVDVMNSIQQLRAKAKAEGNLVDTPQQKVVLDDSDIRIVPAQPDMIYEPLYDPSVIYDQPPSADFGPYLLFGAGFAVGSWLNYDLDWHRHRLYWGDWHDGWDYHRNHDGRHGDDYAYINNNLSNARQWHPDPNRQRLESRSRSVTSSSRSSISQTSVRGRSGGTGHGSIPHPNARNGAPVRPGGMTGRSSPTNAGTKARSGTEHTTPAPQRSGIGTIQRGSSVREHSRQGQGSQQSIHGPVNRGGASSGHKQGAPAEHHQNAGPRHAPHAQHSGKSQPQGHSPPALHGSDKGAAARGHSARGAQSRASSGGSNDRKKK